MFLHGIGMSGYRSFWGKPVRLGPCKKINFIIGKNNSGKSNLLAFLKNNLKDISEIVSNPKSAGFARKDLDRPLGDSTNKIIIDVAVNKASQRLRNKMVKCSADSGKVERVLELSDKLLSHNILTDGDKIAWIRYEGIKNSVDIDEGLIDRCEKAHVLDQKEWGILWEFLTGCTGGGLRAHWIPQTLRRLSQFSIENVPEVLFIPAIREVGEKGSIENDRDYSGLGIIEKLSKLQNPETKSYDTDKKRFDAVNRLLKEVVRKPSARIEIPHVRDTINVELDGKLLPLASLGTGIHELIIMAAVAAIEDGKIICIEEPEIHLHPELQRQFIQYLVDNTNNQYFIGTHSAHMLDVSNCAIFHIRDVDGRSEINVAIDDVERKNICDDLGYHASDILQANAIVWVEGPSDRIYVNKWITGFDPSLIEGVHYSVMFYGGRLLSHLSANTECDDEIVNKFIDLRKLNQNISILIDSDQKASTENINKTKKRLMEEVLKGGGVVWITAGRTIENYVEWEAFRGAVAKLRTIETEKIEFGGNGQYDDRTCYCIKESEEPPKKIDKVGVARLVAEDVVGFDVFDLKEKIEELVRFIRKVNGMSADVAE